MQVFDADKRQKARIFRIVVEGEGRQAIECGDGVVGHVKFFFGIAHRPVGIFQHMPEKDFLAREVTVDERLVDAGTRRDRLYVGALQTVRHEFGCGGSQDRPACARRALRMRAR